MMPHTQKGPVCSVRWWYYVIVPVISTLLTVALIEAGFTLLHPVPFSIESNMYFSPDPFTGYRLKPNANGYFQHRIPARTNRYGHRDEFVPMEKPVGTFRILLLGDSFTVGASVAEDDTYAEVLEVLLNKISAAPVEVINAGVGGWDPFQYAQYYKHYGRNFSPDLVLVGFFVGNDTYSQITDIHQTRTAVLGRRVTREATMDPLIRLKVFLYNHSNIARLAWNRGPTIENVTRKDCADFSTQYLAIQRSRLNNHLKRSGRQENRVINSIHQISEIRKLADMDSIPLVVLLFPDENQVNERLQQVLLADGDREKYDFGMPQSMLLDLFSEAGIPAVDLLPFFKNDARCLYMNDTHWTPSGHALAARVIYNYIVNENLMSGSAPRKQSSVKD